MSDFDIIKKAWPYTSLSISNKTHEDYYEVKLYADREQLLSTKITAETHEEVFDVLTKRANDEIRRKGDDQTIEE